MRKLNLSKEKRAESRKIDHSIVSACSKQTKYNQRSELRRCFKTENTTYSPLQVSEKVEDELTNNDLELGRLANPVDGSLFNTDNYTAEESQNGLLSQMRQGLSKALSLLTNAVPALHQPVRSQNDETIQELQGVMMNPYMERMLVYFMQSLDSILSTPCVFLVKSADPVSIHLAVEYMQANELSNNFIIVHIVDDRHHLWRENTLRKQYRKKMKETGSNSEPAAPAAGCEELLTHRLLKNFKVSNSFTRMQSLEQLSYDELLLAGQTAATDQNTFPLSEALQALPATAERIVKIVSIIDTFYTLVFCCWSLVIFIFL